MKNLTDFGTSAYPLRASSLPKLMSCSWRSVLLMLQEFTDSVGPAAHTGTAVHKAAEIYHRERKSFDDILTEVAANATEGGYPLFDPSELRLHFQGYYNDPRNRDAKIVGCEKQFTFEETQDGTSVVFQGTFDQIRLDYGMSILYDIKTGKSLDAYNMLMEHTLQLACYWLGAYSLGIPVDAVGLIYTYGYRQRSAVLPSPAGVFLRHPMRFDQCRRLLRGVINRVKVIRAGQVDPVAGAHCNICPARNVSTCLPILVEHKL